MRTDAELVDALLEARDATHHAFAGKGDFREVERLKAEVLERLAAWRDAERSLSFVAKCNAMGLFIGPFEAALYAVGITPSGYPKPDGEV